MPSEMATDYETVNVVDVYDIAATIGKEFEVIIDNYGPDAVTELMPRVITVLELLENLASKNQKENAEIFELRFVIEKLQSEKKAKAQEREKYETELEQIEDSWRKETSELSDMVTALQEENRKIRLLLKEERQENDGATARGDEQAEMGRMHREMKDMKDEIHKQRDRLRSLSREVSQKNVDVEALQSQLERLARMNTDYRRKTSLTQQKAQSLIQEKVDLQTQLHDKEQQISKIKEQMKEIDNMDGPPGGPQSPREELSRLAMEGKMLIDMNDPNRPRFTLNELREVLTERNELKTKLIEVEEELQQYKPETPVADGDLPVEGPINREPDEKLYPERYAIKESGIRKFFGFLLSPGKNSSSRRGSSQKNSPMLLQTSKR